MYVWYVVLKSVNSMCVTYLSGLCMYAVLVCVYACMYACVYVKEASFLSGLAC